MSKKIFADAKILICVGSGGVGKTTLAASLAILAAKEGMRVLVLTIDPSKRLAQTLGIEGQTGIVAVPGQNFPGEIFAGVIDHKKTFDDFVARAAAKTGSLEKIMNNRLYKQLSTNLASSQEFTSLEKLYSAYESKEYDLIILDTPPSKHAIDFLNAPQKLSALFNESITKWFRDTKTNGFFSNLVNIGTRQVLKVLELLTGSGFIQELSDFFGSIEKWQDKLQSRTLEVHRMLTSPQTQFCLVAGFDEAQIKEAKILSQEIRKGGYNLKSVIFNRAFPAWKDFDNDQVASADVISLYKKFSNYYADREMNYAKFVSDLPSSIESYRIADFNQEISDLKSLSSVSEQLKKELT